MTFLKRYKYVHIIVATVFVLAVFICASLFIKQAAKLRERKAEKAQLIEQKKAATLENNDLKLLSQYIGTEEYLIYYARYRLGYSYPYEVILKK